MRRRTLYGIALGIAVLAGGALLLDALVETDEERVLTLADALSGPLSPSTLRARSHAWVDLSRAPLELSALGTSELYEDGEQAALFERADAGLRRAYGGDVNVLSSQVRVDGDRARLTARLLIPHMGMANGTWDLERHGEDWLVVRVAVTR